MLRGLFICLVMLGAAATVPHPALAEPFRVALLNTELDRKGPGLLLRDILRGEDDQIDEVVRLIRAANPDAIVLLRFDWDADGAALAAFADLLGADGPAFPHRFASRPNTGVQTDLDLDNDGYLRGPRDAQGYGRFSGQNGMAILSRVPIDTGNVTDLSGMLWRDMPDADLPRHRDGMPFPSAAAQEIWRLSSVGHWVVPLRLPGGARLSLLAFHASPPVFDGPEDANGRRNADELRLWDLYLSNRLPQSAPDAPVVVIGGGNIDPSRGEGRHEAIARLIANPRLQDPRPRGESTPPTATVDWTGITDPPHLRVSYILPDRALRVIDSGVLWPAPPARGDLLRHGLVWVDLALP